MDNRRRVQQALASHRLAPSKKRGQNFLVNPQIAERMITLAGIGPEDTVVELGVGLGALTMPLAKAAGRVVGLEIDRGIIDYHHQTADLPPTVTLIHQDLLKADFPALAEQYGGPLKIMANLPYSLSNPLLFKLVAERNAVAWAILMLQKEVGQRLLAGPGSKEYGVLSVLLACCARVERLMQVAPANFHPRPKVDSVVVRLRFQPPPSLAAGLGGKDFAWLKQVVEAAFRQRRKTLANSLTSGLAGFSRTAVLPALARAGIDDASRPEQLSATAFVRLAAELARQPLPADDRQPS